MDELIVIKAKLHNYRFPKNKVHNSGEYAIVLLEVLEVLEGDIPAKAYSRYGDRTIIVTGNMPRLNYDIEYKVQAKKVTDPKWGIQYECENIRMNYNLDNPDDQRKFLSFFLTDLQIDALFNQFENPIVPLRDNDIDALTAIKGIGPVTANRMCIKYAENIDNGRAYVELKELGITKYAIDRLIKQFGSADVVVELINENPYRLIKLVRGYGWEKADQIALKQGFTTDCKERCIAYAQYRLEKNADDGNSLMSIGELLEEIYQVCMPVTPENLMNYLKEDMANEEMFEELYQKVVDGEKDIKFPTFFFSNSVKKVGLFYYRLLERKIAVELKRLQEAPSFVKYDKETCASIIKEVEAEQGYEYTSEQKDAIYNILFNNVSVLTGSSGVGKSSTVKPLIKIFERYGETVSQCALSGRAASLLTEYTKLEGKTIHRLLGYVADLEGFVHDENNPLSSDVIILDETSMVGEELFLDLIKSIKSGAKLIMLGDIKQLPPMYVGNILSDCMSSGYISVNVLTIIHRQALKSGIISESLKVCEGKYLTKNTMVGEEIRGELQDFKLVCYPDAGLVHTKALEQFKYLLSKGINSDDIQILVPVRAKGMNSCRFFNAEIQQIVNPKTDKAVEMDMYDNGQHFTVFYQPGDKIMIIQNNYHARTIRGKETAVFNGNMGHIIAIDEDTMIIELDDQERIVLPKEQWNTIIHGWACTTHKMQGSQADYVIVCLDNSAYVLLMREWLYTALTRAKKYCILVGQPSAINTACRTSNIKIKQTWLRDELQKLYLESVV